MSSEGKPSTSTGAVTSGAAASPPKTEGKHPNRAKSTVYLANIPFSLTQNDLAKMMERCGLVICLKIVKDDKTKKSKGYAFVQFHTVEAAQKCIKKYHNQKVYGRTWVCNIAVDNGRYKEFAEKRYYPDKSHCYECGELGHMSYNCPKNTLGPRKVPAKKQSLKKGSMTERSDGRGRPRDLEAAFKKKPEKPEEREPEKLVEPESESEDEFESLSRAISRERALAEEEEYRESVASGNYNRNVTPTFAQVLKGKYVKDAYFSDEENLVNDD